MEQILRKIMQYAGEALHYKDHPADPTHFLYNDAIRLMLEQVDKLEELLGEAYEESVREWWLNRKKLSDK